jgi:ribosomal protein S18 acetylase RimI-like enzyme
VAVAIRQAVVADTAGILAVWHASDATPSLTDTEANVRAAILHPSTYLLVAEDNGSLVGTLIATFDGWRGNMYRLAVRPDYRRRGIARALVAEGEALIRAAGARRITALLEHDHAWATAFWEAAGYVNDARIARYIRNIPD